MRAGHPGHVRPACGRQFGPMASGHVRERARNGRNEEHSRDKPVLISMNSARGRVKQPSRQSILMGHAGPKE
jgi:hypothetical protein